MIKVILRRLCWLNLLCTRVLIRLPSLGGTPFMDEFTLKPVVAGSRAVDFSSVALLSEFRLDNRT